MRGIIAKFDRIDMPSGWSGSGEPYEVPVTVWTSEGSRTLRNRARIRMPSMPADPAGKDADGSVLVPAAVAVGDGAVAHGVGVDASVLTANGTCRTAPHDG